MARRDYICCKSCGCKLVYDGYDNIRDGLEAQYGTMDLICPDCLKELETKLAEREQEPAQAVEQPRSWPTGEIRLVDRADGCRGHYAIGRMHKSGYAEYWNLRTNCWASCSDDVLTLDQAQTLMALLAEIKKLLDNPNIRSPFWVATLVAHCVKLVEKLPNAKTKP